MADKESYPGGPCTCLPADIANMMMSTNARFHERASFAASAAQDDNTMMRMTFAAAAQNNVERSSGDNLAGTLAQLSGVINGRPVNAVGG